MVYIHVMTLPVEQDKRPWFDAYIHIHTDSHTHSLTDIVRRQTMRTGDKMLTTEKNLLYIQTKKNKQKQKRVQIEKKRSQCANKLSVLLSSNGKKTPFENDERPRFK